MTSKIEAYGLWKSPLEAKALAEGIVSFADVIVDKQLGTIYHIEGRPAEKGRNVVVASVAKKDITPEGQDTRTGVHEYGGGAAAAGHGKLILSDINTNGVFEVDSTTRESKLIVPDNPAFRYSDFNIHPNHAHLILAVKEDHTIDEPAKVVNTLTLINSSTAKVTTLVEGRDFYSAPRWSNDGSQICWLEWTHPYMPWDGTELYVAEVSSDGQVVNKQKIAGELGHESISQPRWALDGRTLLFLSDASGYYNLHTWSAQQEARPLLAPASRTDLGGPDWQFAQSTFASLNESLVLVRTGGTKLALVTLATGSMTPLYLPTDAVYSQIRVAGPRLVAAIASPLDAAPEIIVFDPTSAQITFKALRMAASIDLSKGYISVPREISYPAGPDPGQTEQTRAYAWFYEPKNADFRGPTDSKPPLVIRVHGGPTSAASPALDLRWQYYTSRGFACADVNFGGSTGKGRTYRDRLVNNWGIVDLDDCVACARYLAEKGQIDGYRIFITGQSSGGYATLAALVRHPNVFAGGVSLYGIADLGKLAEFTHKFESHYLFGLVGGTQAEVPQVYMDRSPLFNAEKIRHPVLVLQGDKDKIVPKEQAETIVRAIKDNGVRVDYKLYAGEGHGWRQASTIIDSAERSIHFMIDVLGITALA